MPLNQGPWAPYQPTDKDPWDAAKVAHLHRRAGFGASRADVARDVKDGPAAGVGRYLRPRAPTADEQGILDSLRQGVLDSGDADRLKAWWLYRVLYDPDPLREKLTLFWHGHFATSNRKVNNLSLMLAQNELFRKHALGPFADLAQGVVGDGAMLVWLDGAGSKKEKPNENFGREFLELFTLGVGNYTEKDIREAARAFTGWSVEKGAGAFHEAAHDAGDKTFLKQTGAWKAADIVRITLEQAACAEFLCKKLYRFFVREDEDPAPELLRPLAQDFREHQYDVGHVVGVILRSRHFYDPAVRRQRIASPVEVSAGLLRALEVPRADVRLLALSLACERQGQDLFHPPNVKGWDGGKAWLNSTTVLERGNWCNDVVWGNADFGLKRYDPLAWARRHLVAPEKAAEALLDLLLQGDGGARARAEILRAGRDGTPDGLRKAVQLIVHCPEFQLA
ncbi:MAG TPA: DUF1800 domain-containing protein [Gemmataceae bacterium]|nr:DUF1800 domain-containing protein [Gemmataceae bacterium]